MPVTFPVGGILRVVKVPMESSTSSRLVDGRRITMRAGPIFHGQIFINFPRAFPTSDLPSDLPNGDVCHFCLLPELLPFTAAKFVRPRKDAMWSSLRMAPGS